MELLLLALAIVGAVGDDGYLLFGVATPYEAVRGDPAGLNGCHAVQMWMLSRHGTRYNTNYEEMRKSVRLREQILANYANGSITELSVEQIEAIDRWSWDAFAEAHAGQLNEQGWLDMYYMAERYKELYPELIGEYKPEEFYFRHTNVQRTGESCHAFIRGLFGREQENITVPTPLRVDNVIMPYHNCKVYKRYYRANPIGKSMIQELSQGKEFAKMLKAIGRRLGFAQDLSIVELNSMYENCRYDKARHLDQASPWCAAFTQKDLELIEYREDLKRFHSIGAASPYGAKLGCHPLKHLRDTFAESVHTNTSQPKVVAMFSHDIMVDMMLTALGSNDDGRTLTATNVDELLEDRAYRASFNIPFAGNIVAVLHRCDDEHKVQLLHNEHPMRLDGCPEGICSWSTFQSILSFTSNCTLDFCDE